ncbi:MAG: hypothetical protein IPK14_24330 [Blastocatellia bacterium]|nr:hypothetical protein [Blastocatellia bacterium]MBL8192591.1 hypothetical protein [Blastocatellia bacterium]MBN8721799.1 hypothetical protein [Acidobacteriota bacterium]
MKQYLYLLITVLLLITVTTISFSNNTQTSILTTFPLEKGNYWLYEGKIKWDNQPNYENLDEMINYDLVSKNLEEKSITWKLEVLETYEFENIKVAVLNDDFSNLSLDSVAVITSNVNNSNSNISGKSVIIVLDGKKYYLITDTLTDKIIRRAKNNNFNFTDLGVLEEEYLMLSLPLKLNSYFGRSEELSTKNDNCLAWCWNVKEEKTILPSNITGANITSPTNQYLLSWGSNNGVVNKQFVVGVGFTQYSNVYHGPSFYEKISLSLKDCKINY